MFALLNLLTEAIEADRYPLSPRIPGLPWWQQRVAVEPLAIIYQRRD
jgi:hypothetical protein